MSSERNIIKRLLEGNYEDNVRDEDLDEKTYTVGDTQYWKRGGKCYKWTEAGGRQECSDDEYFKAISGGKDEPVKTTDPNKDVTKNPVKNKEINLTSNYDKSYMKALSDTGVGPMYHKMGDKFKTPTGVDATIKGFYVDMLGKPKVRLEYEENGKPQTMDYFADEFKKDVQSGTFVPDSGKPERDDTESDRINYDGVKSFDHTTWDIGGYETQITKNPSGRGYYLQNDDFDMEFDTKGDLVRYLRGEKASFAGYDSEKDY